MNETAKRIFDVVASGAALISLSPLILIIAVLVRIFLGSPVLYRQVRTGMHGRPFRLVKFRTMANVSDLYGQPLPDVDRLTPFGQLLRSTSIDELPELCNVIRGDMSLVGPRPLLMEYLPLYSSNQARRHEVRPGITGWAQVNGRNEVNWEEKFRLDVWYVDHQSFRLDLKILFLTLKKVFACEGINAKGEATMSKFAGSIDKDLL